MFDATKTARIQKRLTLLGLTLTIGALTNCKNIANESTGKTLDNFARSGDSEFKLSHCGSDMIPSYVEAYSDSIIGSHKTYVKQALSAVPKIMVDVFFGSSEEHAGLSGKIVVDADISSFCQNSASNRDTEFMSEGQQKTTACLRKVNGQPTIYLSYATDPNTGVDDNSNIYHGVLRSLAYVFAGPIQSSLKTYYNNVSDQATRAKGLAAINDFNASMGRLAQKFMTIINASSATGVKARMARLAYADNSRQLRDDFLQMVFAETVDSIYCSEDTYRSIADKNSKFRPMLDLFINEGLGNNFGKPWHIH